LAVLFVLGCCTGGLINLGIYSLAWNHRPISPWSKPPEDAPLRFLADRIPVIGWFGLRREAPLHGAGFWVRPMLVELFCGAALAMLYLWEVQWCRLVPAYEVIANFHLLKNDAFAQFGIGGPLAATLPIMRHVEFAAHAVLLCFMLLAFWIDIDEMTIPDAVTIPGTLVGLLIVTIWPTALLPHWADTVDPSRPVILCPVWLTSPDYIPRPPELQAPRRYVEPWNIPSVTGRAALVAAIAVFWAWCLSLAPGRWSTRHGYWRAVRVFTARMVREPLTYRLLALAAIGSAAIAIVWWNGGTHWAGMASGLAGVAVGGGFVWIVRLFASVAMRREAMGFGDVTLLAMIGAFLGWQAAVVVFFFAPVTGAVIGMGRLLLRGERELPFGPFLCLATAVTVLFWPAIWKLVGERDDSDFSYFSLHLWLIVILLGCLSLMLVLLPPIRWLMDRLHRIS
jgi:prepilin signal peptidase PulO-like enzyme (type II secretory pathway)